MIDANFDRVLEVMAKARKQGVTFFLENDRVRFSVRRDEHVAPDLLNEIRKYKDEIKTVLATQRVFQPEAGGHHTIEPQPAGIRIPLSFSQERLWVMDQLEGSISYHIPALLRLKGELDYTALEAAFREIVNRHAILRTVIREEQGHPYQHVLDPGLWQLTVMDKVTELHPLIEQPFDLSADHMLRVYTWPLETDEHLVLVVLHHIAADGWSAGIIIRELTDLYDSYSAGWAPRLPALEIQYADYAAWQRQHLSGQRLTEQLDYWKEKLSGVSALELPADYTRPVVQSSRGANLQFRLNRDLTARLYQLSRREDATLFMTLLAAFNVLLYRYSGQDDVCVGSPVAGRTVREVEQLVGFFINTIALRSNLQGNPAFTALLKQVKQTMLEAYDNQETPFEKVVEAVVKERDVSRSPLFQVMFALQNTPALPVIRLGKAELQREPLENNTAKYDLTFSMEDDGEGLLGHVTYCTDLFNRETVWKMTRHFEQLLWSVVQQPGIGINELSLITRAEEKQQLEVFNNTAVVYPADTTIVHLFRAQAQQRSQAVALLSAGVSLTYGQLDELSDRVANYLSAKGVGTETLVPVCMERTVDVVVVMLGVLKAGAAYVPIDPAYPPERIRYILSDTGATLAFGSAATAGFLSEVRVLRLEEAIDYPATSMTLPVHEQRAYVIYTSGSTGQPKGVQIHHKGIANLVQWHQQAFEVTAGAKATAMAGMGFDAFGWEVWPYLCAGAAVFIVNEEDRLSLDAMLSIFNREAVTHTFLSTALVHEFTRAYKGQSLQCLLTGGDQLLALDVSQLHYQVVNNYGPTENSVVSTFYRLGTQDTEGKPLIGRPLSNTQVFITNTGLQLCPVGVPGEICVAGDGVSPGYWNRPLLTAEKMVANPFGPGVLYKTGDMGKWLPDGNIAYLGRADDQVKIRGYRIELGEIENVLQECPLVQQAVVLAHTSNNRKWLAAYIVPVGAFDKDGVNSWLQQRLPAYMLPAAMVVMEKLPVTTNGKVDRKALPVPVMEEQTTIAYTAPRNEAEYVLCEIWQELLGVKLVGVHSNFFELGGDSIIAIQVVSRLKNLGYSLQPKDLFLRQSIAALSPLLQQQLTDQETGEQGCLIGESGLLPVQQWYFEQIGLGSGHFNQRVLLTVSKEISAGTLALAVEELVQQHDALRFVYQEGQHYGPTTTTLEVVPVSSLDELLPHAEKYHRSLDVTYGIVLKAVLFLTPDNDNRLLLLAHHLVVDGVSWRILLEDLRLLIDKKTLGSKGSSYRQWYQALLSYSERQRLLSQKNYWLRVINNYEPLSTDHLFNGRVKMADTGSYEWRLDAGYTRQLLQDTTRAYHTEINDILLSALALTLSTWNNTANVSIGLEGHGREDLFPGVDISRTVGWFTSLYPLLLQLPESRSVGDVLRAVKEQLRQVPDKGLGYGVLKYINRVLPANDPWDLVFNYLGQTDNALTRQGMLGLATEATGDGVGPDVRFVNKLAVDSIVRQGELVIQWRYSQPHFNSERIITLANTYGEQLKALIDHCIAQTTTVSTPADYGLANKVSITELDRFMAASYNGQPRRAQVTSLYRLSGLQEGMLFHSLFSAGSGTYIEQFTGRLTGFREDVFRESWGLLIAQHSILRTAFYDDDFAIPVQCVYHTAPLPLQIIDLRELSSPAQQEAVAAYEKADKQQVFDLGVAPLMRITLLRLTDELYQLLWTSHHILLDGWSLSILVGRLLNIYEALVRSSSLPPAVDDQFENYIRYLDRQDEEQATLYWQEYLQGVDEGCLLPFTKAGAELTKGIGVYKEHLLRLDVAVTARLAQYAQRHHITVNTLMQGVWAYLLYRYTGLTDVVYGITVSGRPEDLPGVEQGVGLYINTLPLHARITPEGDWVNWLQALQVTQSQSREHQYTGLNTIQQLSGVSGDLFDTSVTFQNYPVSEVLSARQWSLQIQEVNTQPHTNYPLTIIIGISTETTLLFTYNSDVLDPAYVPEIAGHFEAALLDVIGHEQREIRAINILKEGELSGLLNNSCAVAYEAEDTFLQQFGRSVAACEHEVAVVFEERTLTYGELDLSSHHLAERLSQTNKSSAVILCVERSPEMIVGMLGILKAGFAYVPVESDFPAERIGYILSDTNASVVVCSKATRHLFEEYQQVSIVVIDEEGASAIAKTVTSAIITLSSSSSSSVILPRVPSSATAYIIYTSGSTGTPKGVMVTHRNLADYMAGLKAHIPIAESHSFGLLSSIATDLGNTVLYPSLAEGKTLHLFSKSAINDAVYLHEYFANHQIDCIKIVPSHWKALSSEDQLLLPSRLLIFGGEALSAAVVESIYASSNTCTVINHYGPTETTIGKLLHVVKRDAVYNGVIPIGKPFSNTIIQVLNNDGQLCPVGVPGELYIGGDGVATGYLNNDALTADKFVTKENTSASSQFITKENIETSTRFYRTGDLVKYTPEGEIIFLGRVDDQVKIRGYRVEPGEISLVLSNSELVHQGVVIAREDQPGNKRLIGYVIPNGDYNSEVIYNYLRERLPEYMVPVALVALSEFPLLPNGKINKRALPDPELQLTSAYTAPVSELEEQLCAIWSTLLEVEQVGIHDDFFALGGDSLLAIRVISAIRKKLNVEVVIGDIFDYPTIAQLGARLSSQKKKDTETPALTRVTRPAQIPLSYSQERLWFIDQLEGSVHYHIPTIIHLKGVLNYHALSSAFNTIIQRHEILRTVIKEQSGKAWQDIGQHAPWQLGITDDVLYTKDETALFDLIHRLINTPFDLSADYLLRVHVIRLNADEHMMVVILHHIISDGWSTGILVKEFVALYHEYAAGQPAQLPVLPLQYADYALWQRNYLSGATLDNKVTYWKNKLTGITPLDLPGDYPRPAVQSTRGALGHFSISRQQLETLQRFSRQEGVTLFMTLLTSFKVLLYRFSGQEDVCVGTPVAGRTQQELEGLIGFFINTLALRSDLSGAPAFRQLLQQVKQTTLEAFEHQDLPFEKVVEAVVATRDISRNPLFQAMFILQNTPDVPALELDGIKLTVQQTPYNLSRFDLTFTLYENENGLQGDVGYCTDLFKAATIQRLMDCYVQLLSSVVVRPDADINTLSILNEPAVNQLLVDFNRQVADYPRDKSIIDIFSERVIAAPHSVALLLDEQTFTYAELETRSNQLANYLIEVGVRKEMPVPICIERSFEMIIGILGILKAGGAYVPVDPDYPASRINYILTDTAAVMILSSKACVAKLPLLIGVEIIILDNIGTRLDERPVTLPVDRTGPAQLAYLIYTSGSTGTPKGVMIEHAGVVNLAMSQAAALRLQPGSRYLQFASFGFDASCYEIFNTLLSGGLLVLPHKEDLLSAEAFAALLRRQAVEVLTLPPSYLRTVREMAGTVKTIVSAGEALNKEDIKHISAQGIRLINAYGPTEGTVCASLTDRPLRDTQIVIGEPIANVQLYILGPAGNLSPVGAPGEICIGGAGLARGYWKRPDLTTAKFITNPHGTGRIYRTGDLGRWLADGSIEYLGRTDDQVKIRGYRIEPGEIENVLLEHPAVQQAVVLARADEKGNKRLVAYVVSEGTDKTTLQTFLGERLPVYMLPGAFVFIEQLPLTPHGKVDRKALPDPVADVLQQQVYIAPRNAAETQLAQIWEDLLGGGPIGIHDNFFERGGDSIITIQVVSRVRTAGYELKPRDLFTHQTISELALLLTEWQPANTTPLLTDYGFRAAEMDEFLDTSLTSGYSRRSQVTAVYPLSSLQEGMLFHSLYDNGGGVYTQQLSCTLITPDIPVLLESWQLLLEQHNILRSAFFHTGFSMPVQAVFREVNMPVVLLDYRGQSAAAQAAACKQQEAADMARGFDFQEPPLMRLAFIQLDERRYHMIWTFHHLLLDGWSAPLLIEKLLRTYDRYATHETIPVVVEDSYEDYIRYLTQRDADQDKQYWQTYMQGVTAPTVLPFVNKIAGKGIYRTLPLTLNGERTGIIKQFAQRHRLTINTIIQGIWAYLLYRYTGNQHVTYGVTVSGRPDSLPAVEKRIGMYINTLPLHAAIDPDSRLIDWLQQLQLEQAASREHQYTALTDIQRWAGQTGELFDTFIAFENYPVSEVVSVHPWLLQIADAQMNAHTNYPLGIAVGVSEEISIVFKYNTGLLDGVYVTQIQEHFNWLLEQFVQQPMQLMAQLEVLTMSQRDRLLIGFNDTAVTYPADETLVSLFAVQVAKTPDAVAVVFEDEVLTYKELDNRANQLAHYLISRRSGLSDKNIVSDPKSDLVTDVKSTDAIAVSLSIIDTGKERDYLIPVCLDRSFEMIIAILGILKAGGAYVPIDPTYPAARINYMLEDTAAAFIITSSGCTANLPADNLLLLDTDWSLIDAYPTAAPNVMIQPNDAAYVIYTSGSTGRPKGVINEHVGIVNRLLWMQDYFKLEISDAVLQKTTFCFDVSVWELIWPLLTGARLVFAIPEGHKDAQYLATAIDHYQITTLHFVPSMLSVFLETVPTGSCASLTRVICSGEALPVQQVQLFREKIGVAGLFNLYGPTEAAIDVSYWEAPLSVVDLDKVPIGRPVANTQLYILDAQGQPVPIGVAGELYIGGIQVARGYLNRPELTAERFVTGVIGSGRMYRTGDLCRWLPDGNIEYSGRMDDQVKLRGYRIELGEIERVLMSHEQISQAVVVLYQSERLIAYIVGTADKQALADWLKARLPEYMVPSLLIEIPAIPLTSNGKADRKALPAPEGLLSSTIAYVAPGDETEQTLVHIWQELLGIERIGIHDNFFALGGHSLQVMRLVSNIRKTLGEDISVRAFFELATIASLARYIRINKTDNTISGEDEDTLTIRL